MAAAALLAPSGASAELVTLATGRVMSVRGIRLTADDAFLALRSGGEIRCPRSLIVDVAPDEVPRPADAPTETDERAGSGSVPGDAPYSEMIARLAARHQVDPALVHAMVRAESAYQPNATSRKGAMGLMQLMPATASQYGVTDAYDPESNLSAGIRHLRSLLERYALREAVAAYNAGEVAVIRHGGVPPFRETQAYVKAVLGAVDGARR